MNLRTSVQSLAIILLAAGALHAGDEFLVDTTVNYRPSSSDGFQPSVAFDGTNYLVVWLVNEACVQATRVSRRGVLLDPYGIRVGNGNAESHPAVVFDGADFFVVWATAPRVYGCRITRDGQVLDPFGILLANRAREGPALSVASDGHGSFAVWTDTANGTQSDVFGARVDQSGRVLDSLGFPVSARPAIQTAPSVAFDGRNYLVAWQDNRNGSTSDIYGARIDTGGVVLDTAGSPISRARLNQQDPAVAFGDSLFLVCWQDYRGDPGGDVYCARITSDALVLDTVGVPVTRATSYQVQPRAAFGGSSFLLDWVDWRNGASDIYGARVSSVGVVLDTAGIPICRATDYQGDAGIAFGDSSYLAVWHDYRYGDVSEIFGGRISPAGELLDTSGFVISIDGTANQDAPCAAAYGPGWLTVWEQYDPPTRVRFTRIAPDGSLLDSAPRGVCRLGNDQYGPAVAGADSSALAVWMDDSSGELVGARISEDGRVRDSLGIRITNRGTYPEYPAVSSDGRDWLVVWDEAGSNDADIWATRVGRDGAILDSTGIRICAAASDQRDARVAFGDSAYLTVWTDGRSGFHNVFAARVTRSGTVLDTDGFRVTCDSDYREMTDVAFGGSSFLVVWDDAGPLGDYYEICGARLNPAGTVIDTVPILIASGDHDCVSPSVVFDGTDYAVAWLNGEDWGVFGTRVSRWGTVLETFPISQRGVYHDNPHLASRTGGQVLAVYTADTDSVNGRPVTGSRIWGRLPSFVGMAEAGITRNAQRVALEIHPNPMGDRGEIHYSLPMPGRVRLGVFDISGREVCRLGDRSQPAGCYFLRWDGASASGRSLANGVYFVRLDTDRGHETRAVILTR